MGKEPGDVTQLIGRWRAGEDAALEELMELVYGEMKKLARAQMRRERGAHTLQTTALVNEAFLKLVGIEKLKASERAYFYGLVARVMRRLLIDHARGVNTGKRGGGERAASLDVAPEVASQPREDLQTVDEAIESLAGIRPLQAEIVRQRFFSGYSHAEIAKRLGISVARVRREWTAARDWLEAELSPG